MLDYKFNGVGGLGVSEMSYHQRPHDLRLAITSEAEALISNFGGKRTLKLAGARTRRAVIPLPGIGAKSRA